MVLYDTGRKPVTLENQVARGGEGVVYTVRGRPDVVGKIYTPMPKEGHDEKLQWMLAHPPSDPSAPAGHAAIAWPRDLLFDGQRHFLGFLMPYVQGAVPVLRVFNPRSRAATLPNFDRRYLHRAAHNLARALGALHRSGYVVGDLNESNVLVTPSALVTLIDTDSFQVQEPRHARIIVYPCPVGKPEYTAPELQGRAFGEILRTWEHDAFALAVLVFQLLMDGNHPFRARWLGQGDPPPIAERIKLGYFPYGAERAGNSATARAIGTLVAPPPGVQRLETLHPALTELLLRCFVEGSQQPGRRPGAVEWEQALSEAEQALVDCVQGHVYSRHLGACPICGAAPSARAGVRRQRSRTTTRPAGTVNPRPAAAKGTSGPAQGATGTPPPPRPQSTGRQSGSVWPALIKFFWAGMAQASAGTTAARPAGAGRTTGRSGGRTEQFLAWTLRWLSQGSNLGAPPASPKRATPRATAAANRYCRRCGWANHPDEIYCQRCGEPLSGTQPCPHCGKPMPQNSRYCTSCSTRY